MEAKIKAVNQTHLSDVECKQSNTTLKEVKTATSQGQQDDVFLRMDNIFTNFRQTVNRLKPPKRKRIVLEWIENWSFYLRNEEYFNPCKMRRYDRGDIIFANFGFKVGNEFGGCHYAIVVENENYSSNGTVIVVPMKSIENEEELDELDWKEVNLGTGLIPWKPENIYNIAKVNQICALSKMRIIRPKSEAEQVLNIKDTGHLENIDKILTKLCTSKSD